KKIVVWLLATFLLTTVSPGEAQQSGKISKVGILADVNAPQVEALRQGMRDLGYIEGQNIIIEYRYVQGKRDRVPELAAELLNLKVDVIIAVGPMTPPLAKAVKSVPIVFGFSGDPVEAEVVSSLARPGGNLTGMTFFASVLAGKRVELLKEA